MNKKRKLRRLPDPAENKPEKGIDQAPPQTQSECPGGNNALPELPEIDVQSRRAKADFTAREDINKIRSVCEQIISDLNEVDVDFQKVNLFRPRSAKRALAVRSAVAVNRAVSYLEVALDVGQNSKDRGIEYIDTVIRAWDARDAREVAESEAMVEEAVDHDVAVISELRAHEDELKKKRLQREKEESSTSLRKDYLSEIEHAIADAREAMTNLVGALPGAVQAERNARRQLALLRDRLTQIYNYRWEEISNTLRELNRHRLWRGPIRPALLLLYAFLVVVAGVIADKVLGYINLSALWVSLVTAITLWAADKWLISPQLDRRGLRYELQKLKKEIKACAANLVELRVLQAEIDELAITVGISEVQLLGQEIMLLPET
jgi:hypothetical protein